jgi:hypothetical protein
MAMKNKQTPGVRLPQRSAQVSGPEPVPPVKKWQAKLDRKVDSQSAASFPARDPPSYAGGNHIIEKPHHDEYIPLSPAPAKRGGERVKDYRP